MISLLLTLLVLVVLWYAVRLLFASHPRPALTVIDLVFLVLVVVILLRYAGLV